MADAASRDTELAMHEVEEPWLHAVGRPAALSLACRQHCALRKVLRGPLVTGNARNDAACVVSLQWWRLSCSYALELPLGQLSG